MPVGAPDWSLAVGIRAYLWPQFVEGSKLLTAEDIEVSAGSQGTVITYTVPSNKDLYIIALVVSARPPPASFQLWLYDEDLALTLFRSVTQNNYSFSFSSPIVVERGHTVTLYVYNNESATKWFSAYIWCYEV